MHLIAVCCRSLAFAAGDTLRSGWACCLATLAVLLGSSTAPAQCAPQWQAPGLPFTLGSIRAAVTGPGGELIVGGPMGAPSGMPSGAVLRSSGSSWAALGTGLTISTGPLPNAPGEVFALTALPNGDVIAGGIFDRASGVPVSNVARWDGTSWSSMGAGRPSAVTTLATLSNGNVVAGGGWGVAEWDGTSWTVLTGGAGPLGAPTALTADPNGDVIAGGIFWLMRWNGSAWSPVVAGLGPMVASIAVLANGDLAVGGQFSSSNLWGLGRWDGNAWHAFGPGLNGAVRAFEVLAGGDLIVAGSFTAVRGTTQALDHVARWDGSSWLPLHSGPTNEGIGGCGTRSVVIGDLERLPNGDLVVVGDFCRVASMSVADVAVLRSGCPATATTLGLGCLGSLASDDLPWVGSTVTSAATGLPAQALGLAVTGLSTTSVPLTVHPAGVPGCDLLVTADVVAFSQIVAGATSVALTIPNNASFAGIRLHQQVVSVELDPLGSAQAITSTNGLSFVLGVL